jgi:hypothetical protein
MSGLDCRHLAQIGLEKRKEAKREVRSWWERTAPRGRTDKTYTACEKEFLCALTRHASVERVIKVITNTARGGDNKCDNR